MKPVILWIALCFSLSTFSQNITDSIDKRQFYLDKSKQQAQTGRILLIGGSAMALAGIVTFSSGSDEGFGFSSGADVGGIMLLAGIAMDFASIPFFVNAAKNSRKAAELSVAYQPLYYSNKGQAAFKIKIPL